MASNPNLKVVVGADTSPFQKGMNQAKQGLKDFQKVSDSTINSIGNALGVNISGIQQYISALGGAATKFKNLGSTGTGVLAKLSTATKVLAGGLAGLGIGAAVLAFKQLTAEANNFKSLAIGQNLKVEADAFRATVKQAMMDVHTETGRAMAEWMVNAGNTWTTIAATIRGTFANILSGSDKFSAFAAAKEDVREARRRGKIAAGLAGEIQDIKNEMSDLQRVWSKTEGQIAADLVIMSDSSESITARRQAYAEVQDLIKQRYGQEAEYLKEIAIRLDKINDQAGSTQADLDKANAAWAQANRAAATVDQQLKSVMRIGRSIESSAAAEAKERQKAAAAAEKERIEREKIAKLHQDAESERARMQQTSLAVSSDLRDYRLNAPQGQLAMRVQVKPELDPEWQSTLEAFASATQDAFEGIASTIGETIGGLFSGEGGWDSLFSGFLKTFGGFITKFGSALMAFGFAKLALADAIKKIMDPMSAGVAIAAGAALVAIGAAISSISSSFGGRAGGYSSSSVASSGYSSTGAESVYSRNMQVEVVGTLRANGSVLEAVLSGENNRKKNVT